MAEQFVNEISPALTLSTAISSTVSTSITPSSVAALPATGTFRIRIDNEYMKASVSGSNLTVTRGDGGSTPATHSSGSTIYVIVTKEALDSISTLLSNGTEIASRRALNFSGAKVTDNSGASRVDIQTGPLIGLAASAPASPSAGMIYIPTDGTIAKYHDGTNWYGLDFTPYTLPPVLSNWTQINMTGSTVSDVPGGGITLLPKIIGSGNVSGITRSIPAHGTAWTRTAYFRFTGTGRIGIIMYDSVTSKAVGYCWIGNSGIDEIFYTNLTSATSNVSQSTVGNYGPCIRLRLQDDGTNRKMYYSSDGISWVLWKSESNTSNVTPNFVGFFMDPQDSAVPSIGTLLHWTESSP